MKITSIQNINNKSNIKTTSQAPKTLAIPFDSVSFGTKVKHSAEFLEATKDNKDLRTYLTKTCMLDKDGNLDSEEEKGFVLYCNLFKESETDKGTLLTGIALARKAGQKIGNEYSFYMAPRIVQLLKNGITREQIETAINDRSFNYNMPHALLTLQLMFGYDITFEDKKFFITRYCQDKDGITDPRKMQALVNIFAKYDLTTPEEGDPMFTLNICDKIAELSLNDNKDFEESRVDFIDYALEKFINYSMNNDQNACALMGAATFSAYEIILDTVAPFIKTAQNENDRFNYQEAVENFDGWFEYTTQEAEKLNTTLLTNITVQKNRKAQILNIAQVTTAAPHQAFLYDNSIYRMYALTNEAGKTIS